jgi:hypothetical protein
MIIKNAGIYKSLYEFTKPVLVNINDLFKLYLHTFSSSQNSITITEGKKHETGIIQTYKSTK